MGKDYPILVGWRYIVWGFIIGFIVGSVTFGTPYIRILGSMLWNWVANW